MPQASYDTATVLPGSVGYNPLPQFPENPKEYWQGDQFFWRNSQLIERESIQQRRQDKSGLAKTVSVSPCDTDKSEITLRRFRP